MKIILFVLLASNIISQGINNRIIIDSEGSIFSRDLSSINKYDQLGNHLEFDIFGLYYDTRNKFMINDFLNFSITNNYRASIEYVHNSGLPYPKDRLNLVIGADEIIYSKPNSQIEGVATFDLTKFADYDNFSFYDIKVIDLNNIYLFLLEDVLLNVYQLSLQYEPNSISKYTKVYSEEIENPNYFNVVDFDLNAQQLSIIMNNCLFEMEEESYNITPLATDIIFIDDHKNSEKYFIHSNEWNSFLSGESAFNTINRIDYFQNR